MSNFQLNTNEYLQQCDPKDVISLNSEKLINISKLQQAVYQSFNVYGIPTIGDRISSVLQIKNSKIWFKEGEECEILRAGSKGWQKGKVKINVTLEFIPDEPEQTNSPLDDIRQQINASS